ncbi:uncharacterized protein LOC123315257 [Coccinella septempunctata]|uniref:uncharacterized protein LOC123315257 n=1 Tax=Coccinella septempunctata TaxID=41139 RepID=UPI001D065E4C|nr:uncharacterized protein LOC123315257 [Coccinella septempunctata]
MTPAEKRDASCKKCGLMFHKSNTCVNTERFCFYCHKKGREKKDCRKLKDQKSINATILNPFGFVYDTKIYQTSKTPQTYLEAMTCSESSKWITAIQSELEAINQHEVWKIVERKQGMKSIPLKWVFTVKDNGVCKTRLVVVGCKDTEKYTPEETASPTPALSVVKLLFALSVSRNWHVE